MVLEVLDVSCGHHTAALIHRERKDASILAPIYLFWNSICIFRDESRTVSERSNYPSEPNNMLATKSHTLFFFRTNAITIILRLHLISVAKKLNARELICHSVICEILTESGAGNKLTHWVYIFELLRSMNKSLRLIWANNSHKITNFSSLFMKQYQNLHPRDTAKSC